MDSKDREWTESNGTARAKRTAVLATDHEIGVSNHVVKVVEILAESPRSWEDAAQIALREASRTLRNIASIYVKDMQAVVRDGHIAAWRINAKISFVVNDDRRAVNDDRRAVNDAPRVVNDDPSIEASEVMGGGNMGYRDQNRGRDFRYDRDYRPWTDPRNERSEYDDDYGLHGEHRREYRGRESYEQQSRGGEGGRSGMFSHRNLPRDQDEPYRNNADEDRRGYQSVDQRSEFISADRTRPDYGRHGRPNDRDYEDAREARYGFDARDYQRDYPQRDFSREYGAREYGTYGRPDEYRTRDDYSRTDYGSYGDQPHSNQPYSSPPQRGGGNGGYAGTFRSRDFGGEREPSFDQGRLAQVEYGRSQFQRRTGGSGPKGYRRSDERIREDVCDRLGHDWEIDASEVEVSVSNGEVTLAGSVNDRSQKFRVEHIADGVSGVNEVHNQLRVKRELPLQGSSTATPGNAQNRTTGTSGTGTGAGTGTTGPTNQNRSS